MPETEAKFTIDGRDYPFPTLDTFDMGEAETLYGYSGVTLDQFDDGNFDVTPGFIAGFLHIAYARGNKDATDAAARAAVKKTNFLDAVKVFASMAKDVDEETEDEEAEGDALPPASAASSEPQPPPEKPSSTVVSEPSSGSGSSNGSDDQEPDGQSPSTTGSSEENATSRSETSAG